MEAHVIIDLVLLAIVLVSMIYTAKKGALRALSSILGTALGALGAFKLSETVAPFVSGVILPATRKVVGAHDIIEKADGFANDLVGVIESLFGTLNLPADFLQTSKDAAQSELVETIAQALADKIAPIIAFLALFIVIKIVVAIVCRVLSLDIPLFSAVNKTAGAILGAIAGIIIVVVLCVGTFYFAPQEDIGVINQQVMQRSLIGGIVYSILQ